MHYLIPKVQLLLLLVQPLLQDTQAKLGSVPSKSEKTAEKSHFQKCLDEPVLQNPEKLLKNPRFENFWVP
jgi:hypothetical protein